MVKNNYASGIFTKTYTLNKSKSRSLEFFKYRRCCRYLAYTEYIYARRIILKANLSLNQECLFSISRSTTIAPIFNEMIINLS